MSGALLITPFLPIIFEKFNRYQQQEEFKPKSNGYDMREKQRKRAYTVDYTTHEQCQVNEPLVRKRQRRFTVWKTPTRRVDREFYIHLRHKKLRYSRELHTMEMIYYFRKYNCTYYLIIVCSRILQSLILRVKGIKLIFGGLLNYAHFCKYASRFSSYRLLFQQFNALIAAKFGEQA